MKFLCRNCKAKYQIADEKVAGRTLRMTCQQCGEPIVVRGPSRQATGQTRAATGPIQVPAPAFASPPAATKTSTGITAEVVRHAPQPAPVEPAAPQEEWHVAINDAPVGPLRRDEVARRIAQGVIDRESLAWREGMDDWMPIKHIAELSALFAAPAPVASAQHVVAVPAPQPRVTAPGVRTDMAPIGGRNVVPVEPYEPSYQQAPEPAEIPEEMAVVAAAPVVSQEAPSGGRQIGWAPMFALVSGGAFILMMGVLLGVKFLAPSNPAPAAPPTAAAPTPPAAATPAPPPAAPAAQPSADEASGNVIELDMQAIDGKSGAARKAGTPTVSPDAAGGDKKKGLTAEQKAMLERMGGGLDQGPSNLRAPTESARGSGAPGSGQLTAEQLSAVVLTGRKNLQRCYETALRGSNSQDTVRLDVDIEVSPNGNVTSVHTKGKGLSGMEECITRTVKMWRFPKSGESTQTRFPVVFQPGA